MSRRDSGRVGCGSKGMVHNDLELDFGLAAPPATCIAASPSDRYRKAGRYAGDSFPPLGALGSRA
jgi:hypothetical protein